MRTRQRPSASRSAEAPFWRLLRTYPLLPATAVILVSVFFSEASRQYRDSTAAVMELATKSSSSQGTSPFIFKTPPTAPNGEPWPSGSGYLSGVPVLAAGGRGSIFLVNPDTMSDVHVKLISLVPAETVVRECLVRAGGRFEFRGVAAGRYEVRYRNLGQRYTVKTDPFEMVELVHVTGGSASQITLKLIPSSGGGQGIEALEAARF